MCIKLFSNLSHYDGDKYFSMKLKTFDKILDLIDIYLHYDDMLNTQ